MAVVRIALATVALAPAALQGCRVCHLMLVWSEVRVELESDDWPPGLYEIEASGHGQVAMCVITLPSSPDDPVSCTGAATLELDDAGTRIDTFHARDFDPSSFVVAVLRDGELVAEEHFVPDYQVSEPNGPGCGETSTATLAMSW